MNKPPFNLNAASSEVRIQFGIQEMLNIHAYLSQLKKESNISPELDAARLTLETHIISFINSLKTGPQQ